MKETKTLSKIKPLQNGRVPWRRFFARTMDHLICEILIGAVLSLVFHMNILSGSPAVLLAFWAGSCLLMLFLEPLSLTIWGTTPGKAVWGLSVRNPEGKRLSFREAQSRAWCVLKKGCALYIPVISLFCLYRSCRSAREGERLWWEMDSELFLAEGGKFLRGVGFLAGYAALLASWLLIWQAGAVGPNKSPLSVSGFCENYNRVQSFFGISRPVNLPDTDLYQYIGRPMYLDENGEWQNASGFSQHFAENFSELPKLEFLGDSKDLTGIRFSMKYDRENVTVTSYRDFMALAAAAFICGQKEYQLLPVTPGMLYYQIRKLAGEYGSFSWEIDGITVESQIKYSDYRWVEGGAMMIPEYGGEPYFELDFQVSRTLR